MSMFITILMNNIGNTVKTQVFKPEDIAARLGITTASGTIDEFLGFAFFILGIIIFIIVLTRILKKISFVAVQK
ncbi:hypothetical protein [Clostridium estertheticum]|uniref:hypothetical protein n=1 Tax=Clostridium estertheticum TaxID=238834 RepID=UPI001C7CB072|nr:hypothetical protein [Clostridium estertheticum]MBX4272023.1 hypothetical protein [Clostridium estertheticum]WLC82408.1 hypothetical protein KTC98_24085 [Clostridium estertheticum]